MQLMHWLLPKLARTDFSRALWYVAATAEPPPSVLPDKPTPAWQSTLTPVMPAERCTPLVTLESIYIDCNLVFLVLKEALGKMYILSAS